MSEAPNATDNLPHWDVNPGMVSFPHLQGHGEMIPSRYPGLNRFSHHCSLRTSAFRTPYTLVPKLKVICDEIYKRGPDEWVLKEKRWEKQPDGSYCLLTRIFDFTIIPKEYARRWVQVDGSMFFVEEQYPKELVEFEPKVSSETWRNYSIINRKEALLDIVRNAKERHDKRDFYFQDIALWLRDQYRTWTSYWLWDVNETAYHELIRTPRYINMMSRPVAERYSLGIPSAHQQVIFDIIDFVTSLGVGDYMVDALEWAVKTQDRLRRFHEDQFLIPPVETLYNDGAHALQIINPAFRDDKNTVVDQDEPADIELVAIEFV